MFYKIKKIIGASKSSIALIKGEYVKFKCRLLYGDRIQIGDGFRIYGPLPIIKVGFFTAGRIKIGNNCILINSTIHNLVGILKPCSICSGSGVILIGNNVGMSGVSIFSDVRVEIGDNVKIGANCFIYDTDFHSLDPGVRIKDDDFNAVRKAAIVIGENAFIGLSSIILKGVSVGSSAIIGAGVVVSKDVDEDTICVGAVNRIIPNSELK